jgi:hypothetical protein
MSNLNKLPEFEKWTDERLTVAGVIARLKGLAHTRFDSTIDEHVGFGWHLADDRYSAVLVVGTLKRDEFIAHLNIYRAVQVSNKLQWAI